MAQSYTDYRSIRVSSSRDKAGYLYLETQSPQRHGQEILEELGDDNPYAEDRSGDSDCDPQPAECFHLRSQAPTVHLHDCV
ncbi:hypothetical protein BGZ94_009985 [Podila epigama]|nr:hypothetical protein BGZ94_009985 [Podila epigama]